MNQPTRGRGRPTKDDPLESRIMFRAGSADVELLDRLVDDERAKHQGPSNPPTRGSVIRWLFTREARARGLDKKPRKDAKR